MLSTLTPLNEATPPTADAVVVPRSNAPAFPVPLVIATVTLPANVVAALPSESRAATARPNVPPETVLAGGWVVKASRLAGAGVTLKAVVIAAVAPVAVAVSV